MILNDFLLDDARKLLADADSRPEVAEYEQHLPLSRIWADDNRRVKRELVSRCKNSIEAVETLQAYWFQQVPPPDEARLAVEWYAHTLKNAGIDHTKLPEFCQESDFCPEDTVVRLEGRKYRPDFFRHLGTMLRFRVATQNVPLRRILELGAGTGNLARLFRSYYPGIRYVIVDLPDTLVFSHMYLRLNFPELTWRWLSSAEKLSEADADASDVIFCPVGFEDALTELPFDLFVNTASMGEMRANAVHYWFDYIQQKISPRYWLTANRYLNTCNPAEHMWRIEENTSALRFDTRWDILDWELEAPFMRCPYVNKHARHLLIVAKRVAEGDKDSLHKRSIDLMKQAQAGSWNKPPLVMSYQDNVLVSDMTMSGILFRLWESLRLDERTDNLTLMLDYLDTLIHGADKFFEEMPQYQEKLRQKGGPSRPKPGLRPPIFITSVGRYNVVLYDGRYFALPVALGPVDLERVDASKLTGVITDPRFEPVVQGIVRAG